MRAAALIAVPAGALGSVALMLWVGHRNQSIPLMVVFAVWVLAPFAALAWAGAAAKRWSTSIQAVLHGLALVLAVGSLAIYGNVAFGPPRPQPAFWFLVFPAASGLLIAMVVMIAVFNGRKPADGQ